MGRTDLRARLEEPNADRISVLFTWCVLAAVRCIPCISEAGEARRGEARRGEARPGQARRFNAMLEFEVPR
jgi:hypothetical protein